MKGESEGDFGGSDRGVGVSRIVGCCAWGGRGALTWDGLVERWQLYVIYKKKIELEKKPSQDKMQIILWRGQVFKNVLIKRLYFYFFQCSCG